ncbi:MAG TPA: tRNA (adenosine(37)-N6)-dimethylallyltransferase MiaA [Bryobacteraceae bacterium]|jgi:tRNA dimethylallyltransferase|nr:tRNA (adenosine(37)-N6)-dimethylallyltransferase MiaA [Bryobacteraceae bacterium]
MPPRLTPLPIVLGPTGSGKSELAIHIALGIGGEIVNCDSLQVYRGFDIGTAKVPEAARRGVPHHLIDSMEPGRLFTAGDYSQQARAALGEIAARGRVPIVVGGTGFYLRALLAGLSEGPLRDTALRERLQRREQKRPLSLYRILSRLDPAAAARIHANDTKKIIRALEVRLVEGRPISELFSRGRDALTGFHPIKIGLNPPRALLNQRLDARTVCIFEAGLLEEVRSLLSSGVSRNAKPFESLGYKQALQVLDGRWTSEQAIASTQLETRRYAKRQATWFRKEPEVRWLEGFGDDPDVQAQALALTAETEF